MKYLIKEIYKNYIPGLVFAARSTFKIICTRLYAIVMTRAKISKWLTKDIKQEEIVTDCNILEITFNKQKLIKPLIFYVIRTFVINFRFLLKEISQISNSRLKYIMDFELNRRIVGL